MKKFVDLYRVGGHCFVDIVCASSCVDALLKFLSRHDSSLDVSKLLSLQVCVEFLCRVDLDESERKGSAEE